MTIELVEPQKVQANTTTCERDPDPEGVDFVLLEAPVEIPKLASDSDWTILFRVDHFNSAIYLVSVTFKLILLTFQKNQLQRVLPALFCKKKNF